MIYKCEVQPYDDASEVEIALQWRGTRNDLPTELQHASREEIEAYLMEKYDGRKEYAIHEDWYNVMDIMCYADDDEDWEHGVNVVCEEETFDFSPEPGIIEYWCKHVSEVYGMVTCDENGVPDIDELETGSKDYCVDEGVFWG